MKREPLLADRFLALDPVKDRSLAVLSPDSFWYAARDNLRLAKTFVLDTDATRYCAELLRKEPRIVADAQDFALWVLAAPEWCYRAGCLDTAADKSL